MPILELALFGGLQLQRSGVPVTGFESVRTRALLVYLVLRSERPHARDALAALLWAERPDNIARNNLRQALNNLQRILQNQTADPPFLLATRDAIQFNRASDVRVDVWEFEQSVQRISRIANQNADESDKTIRDLQLTSSLYRGDLLPHFFVDNSPEFEEWLLLTREKYHQLALEALSQLLSAHQARGAAGSAPVMETAQRILELEVWHEAAHHALMQEYSRAGNRSAALAQYETLRRVLMQDLGVEPSAETNALHAKLYAGENVAPREILPRHNLPADVTPFIGRENELAELDALLAQAETRLVTLIGLGGTGKTRLAIRAASARVERYRDGVFWIALAALHSPDEMLAAFAQTFGLDTTGERDLSKAILNFLRDKEILLVLDNLEHLRGGAAWLDALCANAPRAQLLITSREPLDLIGEQLYLVGGLEYPAQDAQPNAQAMSAVRLFVNGVRRVEPRFALNETNVRAVFEICRQVMGLPLALELAAAWVNVLSVREIANEIRDSLQLLETTAPNIPARQRSVRAVLEWATGLLSATERDVLHELLVFHGGFTRDAAQKIASTDMRTLRTLTRLALLQARGAGEANRRYDMHELVRQFARTDLDAQRELLGSVAARHSAYFLHYVSVRANELRGREPQIASAELRADLENVRAAWEYALAHEHTQAIAASAEGLSEFYSLNGLAQEGEQVFRAALTRFSDARLQAQLSAALAHLAMLQGKYEQSAEFAQAAVEIGERLNDRALAGAGYLCWGQAQRLLLAYPRAAELLHKALELTGDKDVSSHALVQIQADARQTLGQVRSPQGKKAKAKLHCMNALELYRALHNRRGEAQSLSYLGLLALDAADYDTSERTLEKALDIFRSIGDARGEGIALSNRLLIALDNGDYLRALVGAQRALDIFQRIGERTWECISHVFFARVYDRLGAYARALFHFERFFEINRSFDTPRHEVDGLSFYALVMSHTASPSDARRAAERAVERARAAGDLFALSRILNVYGNCLADLKLWEPARTAFHESSALMAQMGIPDEEFESVTGLARIALVHGSLDAAYHEIIPALEFVETRTIVYAEEPMRPYWTLYLVLQARGDANANALLERAYALLQERAVKITDETLRRSYLENVAWNRELIEAWNAAHSATP